MNIKKINFKNTKIFIENEWFTLETLQSLQSQKTRFFSGNGISFSDGKNEFQILIYNTINEKNEVTLFFEAKKFENARMQYSNPTSFFNNSSRSRRGIFFSENEFFEQLIKKIKIILEKMNGNCFIKIKNNNDSFDEKIEKIKNNVNGEKYFNATIIDSEIMENVELKNIVVKNSKIFNSKILNDKILEISDCGIHNVKKIHNIQGNNFKIWDCENNELENVELDESKIVQSNIYGANDCFLFISNSTIKNVKFLKCGIDSEIINNSNIDSLINPQLIEGTIKIDDVKISSENVILFNEKKQKISISNSEITEDVSIFNNANIKNAKLSGNATFFNNTKVIGSKKNSIEISGYVKSFEKSYIKDDAKISGFINIYGESEISGLPTIYGIVNILDDARVSGKTELKEKEIINKYMEKYA